MELEKIVRENMREDDVDIHDRLSGHNGRQDLDAFDTNGLRCGKSSQPSDFDIKS